MSKDIDPKLLDAMFESVERARKYAGLPSDMYSEKHGWIFRDGKVAEGAGALYAELITTYPDLLKPAKPKKHLKNRGPVAKRKPRR